MLLPVVALLLVVHSNPCADSFPIDQGEAASCDGVVVPSAQAVKAIACVTVDLPTCAAELSSSEKRAEIVNASSAAQMAALNTHINACERALLDYASEEKRAWWDSPSIGFGAGVLVTTATVVALLFGQK